MEFAGVYVVAHIQYGVIEFSLKSLSAIEGVGKIPNKVSLTDGC